MIYEFDEETIVKRKRLIKVIAILMPFFSAALIFCSPYFSSSFTIKCIILLFTNLILIPTILIASFTQFRQLRQMSIKIENDSFVQKSPKSEDTIILKDVARLISVEDKDGIPVMLKIYSKNRVDHLFGFKSMKSIRDHISSYAAIEIEKKTRKIDWENLEVFIPYIAIICLITIVAFNFDQDSYMKFAYILGLSAGLFFIMYRPLSKSQGSSKRKLENILGWFLIIINIINFILSFYLTRLWKVS